MKVTCEIQEKTFVGETGRPIPGIRAHCTRCGHETESYGTSHVSIRRCLYLMRAECPEDEHNYYINEDE